MNSKRDHCDVENILLYSKQKSVLLNIDTHTADCLFLEEYKYQWCLPAFKSTGSVCGKITC